MMLLKEQCARGPKATTRILRRRFPRTCETVGQVFKFVWRLHWKINVVCMSLTQFVSFQSRFVTYLLTFPRIWNHLWLKHSVTQKPQYKLLWPQKPKLKTSHIINSSPTKSYHFFNFMTLCSLGNILMGIQNFMVITAATKNCLIVLQTKLDSWWHTCRTRKSAAGYQRSHKGLHKEIAPWMLEV